MEVASSTNSVSMALERFLRLLFFLLDFNGFTLQEEGQNRLTENPEPEGLAVHIASDSFRPVDGCMDSVDWNGGME